MPGSGINKTNIISFKEAGFEMVHFSALKIRLQKNNPRVSFFSQGSEGSSDKQTIAEIHCAVASTPSFLLASFSRCETKTVTTLYRVFG